MPKKLGEMLSLIGGPGGGDWKWGESALQIGATVVHRLLPRDLLRQRLQVLP